MVGERKGRDDSGGEKKVRRTVERIDGYQVRMERMEYQ